MQNHNRLGDVKPNKSNLSKLKKAASLSKWQKDFLAYMSDPVLLKIKKSTKPIWKWTGTREQFEKMLMSANEAIKGTIIPLPTNPKQVQQKPYYDRQYIQRAEWLQPHELVYISNILSNQLHSTIQVTHIDRNRIVEFKAQQQARSFYHIIRISIKKIKKIFANKDNIVDIKSIRRVDVR